MAIHFATADPIAITEHLVRTLTPRAPSWSDQQLSIRLWAEARRQAAERGPAPSRSPYDGTILRRGEPEQITPLCVGSATNRICMPAVGGVWLCRACGAQTLVTPVVGPRVSLCDCAGLDVVCVHPGPPRRAYPPARGGR